MSDPAVLRAKLAKVLAEDGGELTETETDILAETRDNPLVWTAIYYPLMLRRTLKAHAVALRDASADQVAALNRASEAADKHSDRLIFATWVLVFATLVLALATIALVCVEYTH